MVLFLFPLAALDEHTLPSAFPPAGSGKWFRPIRSAGTDWAPIRAGVGGSGGGMVV